MKKLLKAITFTLCMNSMVLAGCSSDGGDESGDGNGNGSSSNSVKTAPLPCKTGDGAERSVVCEVAVGNFQASNNALGIVMHGYLFDIVLPKVCGGYQHDPLETDPEGFNQKVQQELDATVVDETGWIIESVSCKGSN